MPYLEKRYNSFVDAPDLYINSFYDAETNEVAAFEELIGCHGGMGGYQTRPFVLYPSEWELDNEQLIGAPAVYHQFFAADDTEDGGVGLWKTDGTAAGTAMIVNLGAGTAGSLPAEFAAVGSEVYFTAAGGGGEGASSFTQTP